MRRVRTEKTAHQSPTATGAQVSLPIDDGTVMLLMIQALIPLGLKAVEEALQHEVTALVGARYATKMERPPLRKQHCAGTHPNFN